MAFNIFRTVDYFGEEQKLIERVENAVESKTCTFAYIWPRFDAHTRESARKDIWTVHI